jgi:hypothetical protein
LAAGLAIADEAKRPMRAKLAGNLNSILVDLEMMMD